jgi:hypothetical protein
MLILALLPLAGEGGRRPDEGGLRGHRKWNSKASLPLEIDLSAGESSFRVRFADNPEVLVVARLPRCRKMRRIASMPAGRRAWRFSLLQALFFIFCRH